jgi:hypothetical protein
MAQALIGDNNFFFFLKWKKKMIALWFLYKIEMKNSKRAKEKCQTGTPCFLDLGTRPISFVNQVNRPERKTNK